LAAPLIAYEQANDSRYGRKLLNIIAGMVGTEVSVSAARGDRLAQYASIAVIESMKIDLAITVDRILAARRKTMMRTRPRADPNGVVRRSLMVRPHDVGAISCP
jgi:acetyl/propionyl-CoA carboxylase alpha subunit